MDIYCLYLRPLTHGNKINSGLQVWVEQGWIQWWEFKGKPWWFDY